MAKRADTASPKSAPILEKAKHPATAEPALSGPKRAPKTGTKPNAPPPTEELTPKDLQAIFGENLKAARREGGLTQSDLAERSGMAQQRLSKIESGRLNITLKTMMTLAQVVNRQVSAMLQKVKRRRLP